MNILAAEIKNTTIVVAHSGPVIPLLLIFISLILQSFNDVLGYHLFIKRCPHHR